MSIPRALGLVVRVAVQVRGGLGVRLGLLQGGGGTIGHGPGLGGQRFRLQLLRRGIRLVSDEDGHFVQWPRQAVPSLELAQEVLSLMLVCRRLHAVPKPNKDREEHTTERTFGDEKA